MVPLLTYFNFCLFAQIVLANNALLASWMSQVPDSTPATHLSIPGLYSIHSTTALYTALQQGARAIDVRLSAYGTDFHLNQDEVSEDAIITLSSVFDKSMHFLRLHPSESLLFIMRSEEFITDDLLDFLYRYRNLVYADDWSEGVPKMKDLRGKIWLIASLDEMEDVSPWIIWEKNSKAREGAHAQGAYVVEDLQRLQLASYETMIESKLDAIIKNLRRAYSSQDSNELFLTYTSVNGNSHYSSLDLIDGIWPLEGLHSQVAIFLDQAPVSRNTRAGIVIMDWNTDSSILNERLLRPYLASEGPLRLQLE